MIMIELTSNLFAKPRVSKIEKIVRKNPIDK